MPQILFKSRFLLSRPPKVLRTSKPSILAPPRKLPPRHHSQWHWHQSDSEAQILSRTPLQIDSSRGSFFRIIARNRYKNCSAIILDTHNLHATLPSFRSAVYSLACSPLLISTWTHYRNLQNFLSLLRHMFPRINFHSDMLAQARVPPSPSGYW